jgi:hypothetical protein
MTHCWLWFCANDARYKDDYFGKKVKFFMFTSFHRIAVVRKQWIVAIQRDEGSNFKVCLQLFIFVCEYGNGQDKQL